MKVIPSQVPERSICSETDVLLTWLLSSKATYREEHTCSHPQMCRLDEKYMRAFSVTELEVQPVVSSD